jgi:hypothetical protein
VTPFDTNFFEDFFAVGRLFQPLLFFLARCTEHELRRQIEFLKAKYKMLRKRVPKKRILLTKPAPRPRPHCWLAYRACHA